MGTARDPIKEYFKLGFSAPKPVAVNPIARGHLQTIHNSPFLLSSPTRMLATNLLVLSGFKPENQEGSTTFLLATNL
jgi:hypothetical protein